MTSIVGIMASTACASELGIFTRLAAWIEPRTRGPVKHAFRFVFVTAALTAIADGVKVDAKVHVSSATQRVSSSPKR